MLCIRMHVLVVVATTGFALAGCTSTGSEDAAVRTQKGPTQASTQESAPIGPAKGALPRTQKTGLGPTSRSVGAKDASRDVKLSAIRVDAKLGTPWAEVTLTNNTTKRSNYIVDLRITAPGGGTELDAAMVSAPGLAPGRTIKRTAQFKTTQKLPKGAKLTIVGVARLVA
jgi:hypothetical protein